MALKRKFSPVNNFVLVSPAADASPQHTQAPEYVLDVTAPSHVLISRFQGSIILIFGWLDAQLPHLHKYTEGYHALYPTADQILVRSSLSMMWAMVYGRGYLIASLQPVIEALQKRGVVSLHDPSSRVLVHAFSNGGCFQLATTLRLLSELSSQNQFPDQLLTRKSSRQRPAIRDQLEAGASRRSEGPVFVFDSAPGHVSFVMLARSFTTGIKSRILRALLYIPAGLTVLLFKALALRPWLPFGSREKEPFSQMRDDLMDPVLIPLTAPRLYIYSMSDPLVPGQSVEEYIERHREAGITTIVTKRDDRAAHVSHLRLDPSGYWQAIHSLWRRQ